MADLSMELDGGIIEIILTSIVILIDLFKVLRHQVIGDLKWIGKAHLLAPSMGYGRLTTFAPQPLRALAVRSAAKMFVCPVSRNGDSLILGLIRLATALRF